MNPVYVVDGARTPFLKSKNRPGPFAASDLATQAGRSMLIRQKFAPGELEERNPMLDRRDVAVGGGEA